MGVVTEGLSVKDIVERLEEAGKTEISLPERGYSPKLAQRHYRVVRRLFHDEAAPLALRPPAPSAEQISRMEEAFGWVLALPESEVVTRRILFARAMVHPISNLHIFSWRQIGRTLGLDYRLVQKKFGEGVNLAKA